MPIPDWTLELVRCPACEGRLAEAPELSCSSCGARFPVLGGVPVLVPDPHAWCAAFHDAALAALAEAGRATREAVRTVESFASGSSAPPMRFGDDWTADEGGEAGAFDGPPELTALIEAARRDPFELRLLGLAGDAPGVAVELGAGAGVLTRALRRRASHLLVGDLSLRAVLRATRHARGARGAELGGVVLDAEALPLRSRAVDRLFAANVIDLLDDPAGFLADARRVLRRRGRLLLSTPAPGLGSPTGSPEVLRALLEATGLRVRSLDDGVPWLRVHGSRHLEVYVLTLVDARAR